MGGRSSTRVRPGTPRRRPAVSIPDDRDEVTLAVDGRAVRLTAPAHPSSGQPGGPPGLGAPGGAGRLRSGRRWTRHPTDRSAAPGPAPAPRVVRQAGVPARGPHSPLARHRLVGAGAPLAPLRRRGPRRRHRQTPRSALPLRRSHGHAEDQAAPYGRLLRPNRRCPPHHPNAILRKVKPSSTVCWNPLPTPW
jgi:hypothetical protein